MRIALLAAASSLLVLSGAVSAAAGRSSTGAASIYVVRPDPRACPAPMCGGYWVALANHARTRCSDGLLRPRCHVTYVEDATHQPTSVPANGLARAILVSKVTPEWGELGVLRIIEAWTPVGPGAPSGGFYRVRDTGVRCIRAPCFSYRAFRLNGRAPAIRVSSVELGSVVRDPVVRGRAQAALGSGKGLLAAGRFGVSGDRGRVLQATQLYLEP